LDRRTLIKGAAVVGAGAWIAPTIETHAAMAAAGSPQPVLSTCCQCFNSAGAPVASGQDDFTQQGCANFCAAANRSPNGTFVLFQSVSLNVFSSSQVAPTGCTATVAGTGTYLGSDLTCPSSLPPGVRCVVGTWP
jgi:hypothetical protein